ncbi:MAG: MAPEG family protein [Xanthomonadaceae bacterium]|jgi:hypothetical protein|nr:MAPEG family protein [Xanthomonadaceae bacterium]
MQTTILWPMLCLIGWTLLVLLLIPYRRFKTGFRGQVTLADFHCGESENVPYYVALPNRVFMNLLEVPVLFYALCLMVFVTGKTDTPFIALAWIYFLLRVVHSVIYLTYNHVIHRFFVFAISNLIIAATWIRLILVLSR